MELQDVLQAILDKAGDKEYYIDVSVDKEDGEITGGSIRLCKAYKGESAKVASTYEDDRAGKVTIHEREETETNIKPSVAKAIKTKLKI